jgi:hypothetical protein
MVTLEIADDVNGRKQAAPRLPITALKPKFRI